MLKVDTPIGPAEPGDAGLERSSAGAQALQLIDRLMAVGIDGAGPMKGALELAQEYERDPRYATVDERVDALVRWETGKNFTTGLATGLGGLATLPVSVPVAVGASWAIQARMVAAIAHLHGHDIRDDRVRTLVVASLVGDEVITQSLRRAGIDFSQRAGKAAVQKVPGRVLIAINKRVGSRLLTKAGTTGVVNLTKLVPILGGVVGGGVDAAACRSVATVARKTLPPQQGRATVSA